jgi:hydroxymethylbilane synthase
VRPDLAIEDLRGNVDSRIAKVRTGPLDATILAVAGLTRLGRADEIDEVIAMSTMLPAPAQGALAVEARSDDAGILEILAALDDADARLTTSAERAVLSAVSATCASAVGAFATIDAGTITLTADVSGREPDQYVSVVDAASADSADAARALGLRVGQALLDAGAGPYVSPSHV